MISDQADRPYWGQAGELTFYLVVEGRILAFLYWSSEEPAHLDGPGGEPTVAEAGWSWVLVGDPDNHFVVRDAAGFEPGMDHQEIAAVSEAARELAATEILAKLG